MRQVQFGKKAGFQQTGFLKAVAWRSRVVTIPRFEPMTAAATSQESSLESFALIGYVIGLKSKISLYHALTLPLGRSLIIVLKIIGL